MLGRTLVSVVLCAIVALGLPSPAVAAEEEHPEWGSTSAPDAVLKKGCKGYAYSYRVTPPEEGDWSLELFFYGPKGKRVGSAYFLYGGDPEADTRKLTLCKKTVRTGRYTIEAFFSMEDGNPSLEGWLPTSHFRLHRPHR